MERSLVHVPPARVRMLPVILAGMALWIVALAAFLLGDRGATARDVAIAGIALGLPLATWARRMDRHLPPV